MIGGCQAEYISRRGKVAADSDPLRSIVTTYLQYCITRTLWQALGILSERAIYVLTISWCCGWTDRLGQTTVYRSTVTFAV